MNKTYACTDLHGMWDLWEQIKNYCDDTDTIYFLGDAADRGPEGIHIIQDMLEDPRVKYIQGNHEEMLTTVAPLIVGKSPNNFYSQDQDDIIIGWWIQNGGYKTIVDFLSLSVDEQNKLIEQLNSLEYFEIYENTYGYQVLLTHAGTCLDYTDEEFDNFKDNPYLWDREHFFRPWNHEEHENWIIVHGHTPVQIMGKLRNKDLTGHYSEKTGKLLVNITNYCDNHKFNLDLYSAGTGEAALFDLDELRVVEYFECEVPNIDEIERI